MENEKQFTNEVIDKLDHYVYRLIDPRNGKTFYIGSGKGNRVFAHIREDIKSTADGYDNTLPLKLDVIKRIKAANLQPIHVIHRHGMSKETSIEVEAALIDATPGLTNVLTGHGSNERGPAHVDQLVDQYGATEIDFDPTHKLLVIKVKRETIEERRLYDAVRWAWKIDRKRAGKADYVLAVVDGICQGVFVVDAWQASEEVPGRHEFRGREVEGPVSTIYKGRRIPDRMRKPGMAAPILYEGC